jgi:phytoene dehydrogenase-like protein
MELTLPGFIHDVCSAVYPMAVGSPFFRSLPLAKHGVEWITPPAAYAHPLDGGTAVVAHNSLEDTIAGLGEDGPAYRRLIGDFVSHAQELLKDALSMPGIPRHPFLMAKFGLLALRPARSLARAYFKTERARSLFAGVAGHAMGPLEMIGTAAPALVLAVTAHATGGWPFVRGGSQQLTNGLISYLKSLGGELITDWKLESLGELPVNSTVLLDLTPRQVVRIAGDRLPGYYRRNLERFKYGMGAFKIDWALSEPVPWRAAECRLAGTVHVGGSLDEICESERRAWRGELADRPYVLFSQPSLFDSSRAPAGRHTAWGYCHVPHGFSGSMLERIEDQIERFAPGFRDCVLARSVLGPLELEKRNANLIGGDIGGGAPLPSQLLLRPSFGLHRTPLKNLYLCSSSTPPGPGVHGMCGYQAAQSALSRTRQRI